MDEQQQVRSRASQCFAVRVSGSALREAGPPGLDDTDRALIWRVEQLEGEESLDQLFEYRLRLKRAREFDPQGLWDGSTMTGRELTVHIELPDGARQERAGPRAWGWGQGWRPLCGLVTRVEHVGWDERDDEFELWLHPWLFLATTRTRRRIHQDLDVRDLLRRLLDEYAYPVEWRLQQRYPVRDYQVQYDETDLDFLQRIAQEWGIHYHFEHEVGRCVLVLGDGHGAFGPGGSALYEQLGCVDGEQGGAAEEASAPYPRNPECIEQMSWHERLVAGTWEGADYDYLQPRAPIEARASDPLPTAQGALGGRRWRGHAGLDVAQPQAGHEPRRPGEPDAHQQAQDLAQLRLQAQRQLFERASGRGALRGVQAGQRLRIHGHWLPRCNDRFIVLGTRLSLRRPGGWQPHPWEWAEAWVAPRWRVHARFTLQPARNRVRPLQWQPKPEAAGLQLAVVMGRTPIPGRDLSEPCLDALGRIRVRLAWDDAGPHDEGASCWVRVCAPAAGQYAGEAWWPRAGQEVLVAFIDGDHDAPVCVGSLHGASNPPPWELPANAALSGVRTREWGALGGNAEVGRSNQLVLDDTPGQLQAHVGSEQARSQLSLGVLNELCGRQGRGHVRVGRPRGEGFELRSDAQGVLRAGRGLLLSTHARPGGAGALLDLHEPLRLLRAAQAAWVHSLEQRWDIDLADPRWHLDEQQLRERLRRHVREVEQWDERARRQLEAMRRQEGAPAQAGDAQRGEHAEEHAEEHAGDAQLLLGAAGPLLADSGGDMHVAAGEALALQAAGDVQLESSGSLLLGARRGLRALARRAGMFLVARAGLVQLQAPRGRIHLHGQQLSVVSSEDWIEIGARERLELEFGATRLSLSREGIRIDTPGDFVVQAPQHGFKGPTTLRRMLVLAAASVAEQAADPPAEPVVSETPRRIVPIVFLPGIMGSNLRLSRQHTGKLERSDNRAWRPDDLGLGTVLGLGAFGSFIKKATARERQLNFDPEHTELDRYPGTEDPQHFDAQAFDDQRHDNVCGLTEVDPLLLRLPLLHRRAPFELAWPAPQRELSGARKARLRGWSEVHWDSYGTLLGEIEERMNTMRFVAESVPPGPPGPPRADRSWLPFSSWRGSFSRAGLRDLGPVGVDPGRWGRARGAAARPLLESEVFRLGDTLYPVHAVGYNWLQPNAQSARGVAARIRELVRHYRELGAQQGAGCPHVLVMTHSMGGLVARALTHPELGALEPELLGGVSFNVMPTHGAGTTYKRMRAGMTGEGGFLSGWLTQRIFGRTAREMLPVVANASGPLELYPAGPYGDDWLRARWTDAQGRGHEQVLDVKRAIEDPGCWWRAVNPEWINPADGPSNKNSFDATRKRLRRAAEFHASLEHYGPIANSSAGFANDSEQKSWGNVYWGSQDPLPEGIDCDATTWALVHDDACGGLRLSSHGIEFEIELLPAADAGDGTVPAARSGAKVDVEGTVWEQRGYEHAGSYKDDGVLSQTLYSLVRMDQQLHD